MGTLISHRAGPVWTLELSNAGKANALDLAMLDALDKAVSDVERDESVRVVVLRGPQGGPFSSGADIGEWGPMSPEQFGRDWIDHGNIIFRRFEMLRCPTIASVEGICFGGGLELALCADLRIASQGARFRFPEVAIGAMPGWEGGPRLARTVGRGRALEAVLCAGEISAELAHGWGLVNAWCPQEAFEGLVASTAERLARVSPCAARHAKAAILGNGDSRTFHRSAATALKGSRDAAIGIQAFAAKSAAVF
ncbi:enoyl-CoA hydratase/isomerase family protein [Variovorax humicola]|uniref:Enoyl-CoA hydratase/isomerase family protein n=1 Tax=Variovorax humicola TaxID=1769758 RepID=A0ABU8W378_9BURK